MMKMMIITEWLLKFVAVWLSIDTLIVVTAWYLVTTIKPLCPDWWRRVVIDEKPKFSKVWLS